MPLLSVGLSAGELLSQPDQLAIHAGPGGIEKSGWYPLLWNEQVVPLVHARFNRCRSYQPVDVVKKWIMYVAVSCKKIVVEIQ